MTHTNTAQRPHKIAISDEIKGGRNNGQIYCWESESKEEGNGCRSIVLGPQVNDDQTHIFPHSSHLKVVIYSLNITRLRRKYSQRANLRLIGVRTRVENKSNWQFHLGNEHFPVDASIESGKGH